MIAPSRKIRWLGMIPILLGGYVLVHLAHTEEHVSLGLLPAGILALLVIAAGCLFFTANPELKLQRFSRACGPRMSRSVLDCGSPLPLSQLQTLSRAASI